jgi:hypothetical protein
MALLLLLLLLLMLLLLPPSAIAHWLPLTSAGLEIVLNKWLILEGTAWLPTPLLSLSREVPLPSCGCSGAGGVPNQNASKMSSASAGALCRAGPTKLITQLISLALSLGADAPRGACTGTTSCSR